MTTATLTPAANEYLESVRRALVDLPEDEREEILVDLAVQLADLAPSDAADLDRQLGSPEVFASELREAAGMTSTRHEGATLIRALTLRLEALRHARAVTFVTARWRRFRPVWLAIRGWLLVASISVVYNTTPFAPFPVPEVAGAGWTGAGVVGGLTWLSYRLARTSSTVARIFDGAFTLLALLFVSVTLGGSFTLAQGPLPEHGAPSAYPGLLGTEGPITNIYAFDRNGEPVEVLLYDQEGRPILTMPELAQRYPGELGVVTDGKLIVPRGGRDVVIPLDENGRPIPNLYPLEEQRTAYRGLTEMDEVPIPPPTTISIEEP